MVDLWMPQGTHIDETTRAAKKLETIVTELEGVTHVTSLVGKGGLRFLLTYTPEKSNSAYAQLLVDVTDSKVVESLIPRIDRIIEEQFSNATGYAYKFELGPGANGKIQAQFSGPETNVLRDLAMQTIEIMEANPKVKAIKTDWRQRAKVIRPQMIDEQASILGIERQDVSEVLLRAYQGQKVGIFRDVNVQLQVQL